MPLVTTLGVGAAALLALLTLGGLAEAASPPPEGDRGRARVLATIEETTPSDTGDPQFDAVLGGRIAQGKWRYFEVGYGTTCAIYVAYVLERAGAVVECINRGALFKVGAHATRLVECARARGAYHEGAEGIRAGDIYYVADTVENWHMGFWLSRQGSELLTADGGQTNTQGAQCARFVRRVIQPDARGALLLSGPNGFGGFRRLVWHIDISRLFEDGGIS